MPKILNLAIPIIIAFILFIFLEITLRAFFVDPNSLANYGYNPDGLGDLLPNKNFIDTNVKRLPYLVITNSDGLRNEEEIDFSDNTFRILTIGDSFTYSPYVNNQDMWQSVLERKLQDSYPDKKIQVLNAGVAGYTITDELEYLKEKGIKIKPGLVILGIYANDVNDLSPEKRTIYARSKQKKIASSFWLPFRNIAKQTAVFNWLEIKRARILAGKIKQIVKQETTEKDINEKKNWPEFLNKLEELITHCEDNNLQLLIVLFPHIEQLESGNYNFQQKIKDSIKNKINYLDLSVTYQNNDYKNLYLLPYNYHLSACGCMAAAKEISGYLINNQLIKKTLP